mmetsp:Transcript_3164/g.9100  ORF Transcript_3164/g.9100 Transcript_3164/m.9100 type:complete len:223 (-) Transcript_3164:918-1586(-)
MKQALAALLKVPTKKINDLIEERTTRNRQRIRSARITRKSASNRNEAGPGDMHVTISHAAQPNAMTASMQTLQPNCHKLVTPRRAQKRTNISAKDTTVHAPWTSKNGKCALKILSLIKLRVCAAVTARSKMTTQFTNTDMMVLALTSHAPFFGGSLRWTNTLGFTRRPPMLSHSPRWRALSPLARCWKSAEARLRFHSLPSRQKAQNTSRHASSERPWGAVA